MFDAIALPDDRRQAWLPAHRDCIVNAQACSIMSAYTARTVHSDSLAGQKAQMRYRLLWAALQGHRVSSKGRLNFD